MDEMHASTLELTLYNDHSTGRSLSTYQWWVGGRRASASRACIIFFIFPSNDCLRAGQNKPRLI